MSHKAKLIPGRPGLRAGTGEGQLPLAVKSEANQNFGANLFCARLGEVKSVA